MFKLLAFDVDDLFPYHLRAHVMALVAPYF